MGSVRPLPLYQDAPSIDPGDEAEEPSPTPEDEVKPPVHPGARP